MSHPFRVSEARPAPINDRLLAQLTRVAYDAPNSLASRAEAEWLLSAAGPLLDELAKRRQVMNKLNLQLPESNVVALPGAAS